MKLKLLYLIRMVSKNLLYGFMLQCLFLTTLMANGLNAQVKPIDETFLTLGKKEWKIDEVFKNMESRTDYVFVYPDDLLKDKEAIPLDGGRQSINDILVQIARTAQLKFKQVNHSIYVGRMTQADDADDIPIEIDQVPILGKVTDQEGNGIPGATVLIEGSNTGTATDIDGNFSLDVPEGAVLLISFIGYQPQRVTVGSQSVINIVLEEDLSSLEEVVVVGYGVQKKTNLTGAVDVISNKQIQDRQSPTVSQLLQGQSPGMSFSISDNGFEPGAEMGINIRGIGSLNGGSPFVLIDGIPGDMDRLNPDDIESISVLKDAAASAVYGARAPYGVILITTKTGQTNEKISVTYSGNVSIASPQRLPRMLDSYAHARILNEAGVEGAGGRTYPNDVVDRIIAYQAGDIDYLRQFTVPDAIYFETVPLPNGYWGQMQQTNANYDWFDEYYGSALNQRHNISLQGGSQSASYYLSAGYFGQEGVLNYGTDKYERINVMGKIQMDITDWWTITYQPRFMKSIREMPNPQVGFDYGVIFHQIARTMPMQAKYDGYGNYTLHSKIPWTHFKGTDQIETTENWQTFMTTITPLKNWEINADIAYQSVDFFQSDQSLTIYESLVDQTSVPNANSLPSSVRQYHRSNNYWVSNMYSSYRFNIGQHHNFNWLVGTQLEFSHNRNLNVVKNSLLVQDVVSLQTALGDPAATEALSHWSTQGYFSRLTYNFSEKYLLELNIRRDGTSRFRFGNRWGTFPSISAGWNVHRENFWQPLAGTINTLKLRGSWGALGNQNVSPYQDINLIPLQTNPLNYVFGYGSSRPLGYTGTPNLVSPDLTWETATSKNIGLDLSFLENRLQTNFDWFERITADMIGPSEAQPGVLGAPLPRANNSTLRTRGWELSIRWNYDINNNFSYYINANLHDSRTIVTQYLNPTGTLSTWYNGREEGEIWGYTSHDLFRSQQELETYQSNVDLSRIWGGTWRPGDVKYEDVNGDGFLNNGSNTINDHGDLSIIGNSTPRYQLGLSAGLYLKAFDFSMLWNGTAKRDLFFGNSENIFWGFTTWNQSSLFPWHLDYFRGVEGNRYTGLHEGAANINLEAYWPRPYIQGAENAKNRQTSTRYLQNGAFLRLQNIQLGYSLPTNLLTRWRISKMRIYFAGENLVTFTSLFKGIDPIAISSEMGIGKTYGADRVTSLGVTITY